MGVSSRRSFLAVLAGFGVAFSPLGAAARPKKPHPSTSPSPTPTPTPSPTPTVAGDAYVDVYADAY